MYRRKVLAGFATALPIAVTGCLGDQVGRADPISTVEFQTGVAVNQEWDDDPEVSIEEDEVHAVGIYPIGNSCYEADLQEPTYDEENDRLDIHLARRHDGSDTCEDIAQYVSYRVTVGIDGPVPDIVEVTERGGGKTVVES
ncbi:hypothetical protein [Haloparvum sp. PAK95]|uniref:hypothetical protein n=1 Tax=Haloparvum sp. PAK95 TaxID=3418962 RepID=UPI003D2F373C